jgi:hypothetical protein
VSNISVGIIHKGPVENPQPCPEHITINISVENSKP